VNDVGNDQVRHLIKRLWHCSEIMPPGDLHGPGIGAGSQLRNRCAVFEKEIERKCWLLKLGSIDEYGTLFMGGAVVMLSVFPELQTLYGGLLVLPCG
jgi:hypothetical protein